MVFVWIWVRLFWASFSEPCSYSAPTPNSPTVDPCGSCRCGPTYTSPRSPLKCILPSSRSLMGKLGCTPTTLKKSLLIQIALNFSVTHRGSSHLKILCLLRPSNMVLKTLKVFQTWVSLGAMLRGALAFIQGIW